ncbi:substrate-binding domain-containing protein [Herbaspirillum lusitanum]|uniref:Substrate-binding domain-containing protein n=1 Tax=Herbaspirillum lusitanum TaxID=213312 RepID=A0ABW9A7T5_9BURK
MPAHRRFLPQTMLFSSLLAVFGNMPAAAEPAAAISVFAAGSLTGPFTVLARQFTAASGIPVNLSFGPAGLLLARIEKGETADVFASANMEHPQKLAREGKASAPVIFTRNKLCAVARPDLQLTPQNFLSTLLDPKINFGTSTPKADPGGDYTWMMFDRAGKLQNGADQTLKTKARQLVGGKDNPPVPAGQDAVKYFIAHRQVDAFIGYCSSRQTEPDPTLTKIELPPELSVAADYGLSVLQQPADAGKFNAAYRFALFVLTPAAQQTLASYGFAPVATAGRQ